MAMKFQFSICPFGYHNDPIEFGTMRVHSAGVVHEYAIDYKTKDGWQTVRGSIPKLQPDGTRRSGHRNFVHLLKDIMNDVDLEALGKDYVHVLQEIREAFDDPALNAGDYDPEE